MGILIFKKRHWVKIPSSSARNVVKSPGTSLEISRGTTALGLTNIMAKPNTLSRLGFDKKLEKFWWGCNKVTHHACDKRNTSAHLAIARAYMVLWQRRKDNKSTWQVNHNKPGSVDRKSLVCKHHPCLIDISVAGDLLVQDKPKIITLGGDSLIELW